MRELSLSIPDDARPGYLRIAEGLRSAIQKGMVQPGERLPSTRILAASLGVHRHTLSAAMDELVAEGWLEAGERRAHRVAGVLPSEFFKPKGSAKSSPFSRGIKWRFARDAGKPFCAPEDYSRFRYVFQSGLPDLRLFPYDELRACLAESLRRSPDACGAYGDPAGHPGFIERFEEYLRRVRAITGRRVIVTHGAQEGIFLVAQLLVDAGAKVAVEMPGYPSAWDAFRAAGGEIVPVKVDKHGMDPEALEAALTKHRIQLIYLTPHHQYPTTATLPTTRRLRIYELASRHQIPIVEDDYDHEFHFRSQPIAPMASTDPCGLVIYMSTLSKLMFPSIRLGCLAVPEALYGPLLNLRNIITRQNNTFMQDAVARWMGSGGFERHLRRMRRVYEERRDVALAALAEGRDRGLPYSWCAPDGGMGLWLDCGTDADTVVARAAEAGVFVTAGSNYQLPPVRRSTHLRLGYASQTPEEIRKGLSLLADSVTAVRRSVGGKRRAAG
jgi:GntR family transcriptional regulator/MocR family aminotransferase